MKTVRALLSVLLFLGLPGLLLAQRPLGGDLQVSVDTHAAQLFPHVAANRSGEFVVTWVSTEAGGPSLHATRFNADGTAATGDILVAGRASDIAPNSAVALMDDGSFAVVFPALDGAIPSLMARWYDPDGSPHGADALVTHVESTSFSVSTNGDGGMVVVWQGGPSSAWFRVFGPSHVAGPETLVDPAGTDPVVAVGPQGGFVVAWRHSQIVARRFTSTGSPSGRRFVIDSGNSGAGAGAGGALHIGKEEDGDFLVLWGAGPTVFGRRFKANGTPLGGLVRAQAGSGYDAAIGGQGNFVLVWEKPDTAVSAKLDIFARRFRFDGAPLGPELRVNEHTRGSQSYPRVAIGAEGGFTVVWQSRPDPASTDVFARQFERK